MFKPHRWLGLGPKLKTIYFKDDQWFKNGNSSQHRSAKRIHSSHEEGMDLTDVWTSLICLGPVTFPALVFFQAFFFWPFRTTQFLVYESQGISRAMPPFLGVYMKFQPCKLCAINLLHYSFLWHFGNDLSKVCKTPKQFSFKIKQSIRGNYLGEIFQYYK